jgi:hypothetical protein
MRDPDGATAEAAASGRLIPRVCYKNVSGYRISPLARIPPVGVHSRAFRQQAGPDRWPEWVGHEGCSIRGHLAGQLLI